MFSWWWNFAQSLSLLTILPVPTRQSIVGATSIREDGSEASGEAGRQRGQQSSIASSVRFFPLVGFIIGLILCGADIGLSILFGRILKAALILALNVVITGGLHLDGFVDTCDGLLSRRDREQTLTIMRDTHVGGLGAAALATLLLVKFASLIDISGALRLWALLLFPVVGRLAMVGAICLFGYARPGSGMGRDYAKDTSYRDLVAALLACVFLVTVACWYTQPTAIEVRATLLSLAISLGGTYVFSAYAAAKLGGLTGDVYGAVNELTELLFLILMASG